MLVLMLTWTVLLAAFLYFGLSQSMGKKTILAANAVGGLLTHLFLMAVGSLSLSPFLALQALIRFYPVYFYNIFDVRWMWLSGIFSFIGGGDLIFGAMLQAFLAETVPNSSL